MNFFKTWFFHNVVAHPMMQLFNTMGMEELATTVHESTLPHSADDINVDASKYSIVIRHGEFDGEMCYQATVMEMPEIMEWDDTADEAYALAIDTIELTAEALAEQGKTMTPAGEIA